MAGIPQVITEDRASGAQFIDGTLKFDSGKSQYLSKTFSSSGNASQFTWSYWVKRTKLGVQQRIFSSASGDGNPGFVNWFNSSDQFEARNYNGSAWDVIFTTTQVFRDLGWYHIVCAIDVTQSTSTDRIKIYVNGERITTFDTTTYSKSQNTPLDFNGAAAAAVGARGDGGADFIDAQITNFYAIDGQSLGPENFGFTDPLTGTWRPKKYTGVFTRSSVNTGTNWTQSLSATSGTLSNGSYAFDGDLSTRAQTAQPAAGKELTFAPPAINFTTSLEVYCDQGNDVPTATWNGNTVNPGGGAWVTVYSGSGELSSTYPLVINTESAAQYATLKGVRIDGEILIDNLNATGANSFYLPMDGISPIGKDQSENGNDFTPIGFGGSVELPKATGALPILKTNESGTVAKGGVRTDSKTYTVTASGGNYYLDGALKPTLNAYRGGSYTFDYTDATSHPFYLSSLQDGKWNSKAYSVQFDGTGDYLAVTGGNNYDFGTGDFTIEGYFYTTNNNGTIASSQNYYTGGNNGNWLIRISSATQVAFASYDGTGNEEYTEFTVSYQTNTWHHFAFVRSGTTLTCYLDGSSAGTLTVSKSLSDGSNGIFIGEDPADLNPDFNGKISNFRINKGTALYTSNFTPPSTTLTNVTGTTLLCCQDSNATDVPVGNTIAVNGNAAASNTSPFLYDTNGYYGVSTGTLHTTKITIPHWASDTLYYYCNIHSGMGSSINVTTDIFKADPYAWKCVLANPLVGSIDDVSNQINCTSTTKVMTNNGSSIPSNNSNFYGGSWNFDYSDDYLSTPDSDDYTFGTGDFTMECWFYQTAQSSGTWYSLLQQYGSDYATFFALLNNKVYCYIYYPTNGITNFQLIDPDTLAPNEWHHAAVTRSGNTFRLFVNGILKHSLVQNVTIVNSTVNFTIGADASSAYHFQGQIQDTRVYKGVAKYTENFVVGSTAPDILPDTPSGITGKSKLAKITNGAVSFDGSGDYLSIPDNVDFDFGTGDFTVELFAYNDPAQSSNPVLIGANGGWYIQFKTGGTIVEFYTGTTSIQATELGLEGGWHHVAVTKESNVVKIFVDGILKTTTSNSDTTDLANTLYIGNFNGASLHYHGFISNVRVIKGTALYTSDFTPPTEPLTEVTNTKLLCCQSPTSATAAAAQPTLSYFTGGTALTWDNSPIGSKWTLSNGDKNATSSGGSGYTGADVFSVALAANTTYAWTLDVTNGDSTGGWYFADAQSNTGTHADQKGGNSLGLRGGETSVGYYGTFATANGGTNGENKITMNSDVSPNGNKSIDFVVYRPASGTGKVWVKANTASTWIGGGDPSNTSSTATFIIPDGTTYFGFIDHNSSDTTNCNMRGDGDITGPKLTANGNAAATNFNPFTDDINAIRGQETGYCTLNPLDALSQTLSNGNLTSYGNANTAGVTGTISVSSGKYYYEMTAGSGIDIAGIWTSKSITGFPGSTSDSYGYFGDGQSLNNGSGATYASSYTSGDIIGVALDLDNGTLRFYKNGIDQGIAFSNIFGEYRPAIRSGRTDTASTVNVNFGQKPFKFSPPDGFQPLSLSNVQPEKVIARPDQYVDIATWTGDGTNGSGTSNDRQVTGLGHKPDLVWCKIRTQAYTNVLWDSVRGPGVNKELQPNEQNQEGSASTAVSGYISEFTSDGFKTVTGTTDNDYFDKLNDTYVAWCWKAGGDKNTFNIDDVGYANASDVGMDVGGKNNDAYNTSQSWSSNITGGDGAYGAASNAFNGDLTNYASPEYASPMTYTNPSPSDTVINTFEIYGRRNQSANECDLNGTDITSQISGTVGWQNITGFTGQNFETLYWRPTSGNFEVRIYAIRINGKILVDSGTDLSSLTQYPSIAATGCSVGTKQGFSIIKYSHTVDSYQTIAHGLSQAPQFIIAKWLDGTTNWNVYHASAYGAGGGAETGRFLLNNINGYSDEADVWGDSAPTSAVWTVGGSVWQGSGNHISYLWHDVPGLQKFGYFSGNGDADGPFVELGFRPALLFIKSNDAETYSSWHIYDTARSTFNPLANGSELYANLDVTQGNLPQGNGSGMDILSNGFKIRTDFAGGWNTSGVRYIYCAWAEAPSINLYGGQTNAR